MQLLGDILKKTTHYLQGKGVLEPRLSAEWLLGDMLGLKRLDLYVNFDRPLDETELNRYRERVRRRALHEPVAYILGHESFCGLQLQITPAVLIPRPETEELVDWVSETMGLNASIKLLDLGTGSGAIALALKKKHPAWQIAASDISQEALGVALANSQRLELEVSFFQSDLTTSLNERYDIVVSNPPYIAHSIVDTLQTEVRDFEPEIALDGGDEGLDYYKRLTKELPRILNPGSKVFFEIGYDQGDKVVALFKGSDFTHVTLKKDSNLKDRFVMMDYVRLQ